MNATEQLEHCENLLKNYKGGTNGRLCFYELKEIIYMCEYKNRPKICRPLLVFPNDSIYHGLTAKQWFQLETEIRKIFIQKDKPCQKSKF